VAVPQLPSDPNDWSDDEWIAWLEAGDAAEAESSAGGHDEERSLPTWRKGPIALQFLAASMTAVGEALYGKKEKPAIVIDAPGDPGDDDGLDVHLDYEHPEESIAIVRPWLLQAARDDTHNDTT
jgi:hypothetical protein